VNQLRPDLSTPVLKEVYQLLPKGPASRGSYGDKSKLLNRAPST